MRGPQAPVSHVRGKEPIVERVELAIHTGRVAEMGHGVGIRGRVHRDGNVAGHRRRAAGCAHTANHQRAERRVIDADEIALRRRGIEVVDALRRVGPGAGSAARQVQEVRHHNRSCAKHRALAHDVPVGMTIGLQAERRKYVAADVQRVGVDAQRAVIQKSIRFSGREREVRPHRGAADRAGVAHRQHRAIA